MAKEILAVPEQHLEEVIKVIRAGLGVYAESMTPLHPRVISNLEQWCNEEEEYLKRLQEDE